MRFLSALVKEFGSIAVSMIVVLVFLLLPLYVAERLAGAAGRYTVIGGILLASIAIGMWRRLKGEPKSSEPAA